MKASSIELETTVYLNEEEVKRLRDSGLIGLLKFREYGDNKTKREILFEIVHDKSQEDFLKVRIEPQRTYFGEAGKITYTINDYLYDRLVATGSCGDRFLTEGKLLIFTEGCE